MFNYTGGGLIYVRAPWLHCVFLFGQRLHFGTAPKHRILPAYLLKVQSVKGYTSNQANVFLLKEESDYMLRHLRVQKRKGSCYYCYLCLLLL